jgi:molybdenum cofactor synthesis domain-containing protein
MRAAVLTVSDGVARGEREDASGELLADLLAADGYEVSRRVVADDREPIADAIRSLAEEAQLVLTTGGTGVAPRDVTPEATRTAIERDAPGIAERIRVTSLESFPRAALSRGLAGVRARTLVVNLPGSTGGVRDALGALEPIVDHAVDIVRDAPTDHSGGGGRGHRAS